METVFSTGRWFWPGYLWTGFTERGGGGDGARREREVQARYFRPFFVAYFFYYAGYCVFSSFIVLFLTERGYSAAVCGVITSLTLLTNLLMEPVGGYLFIRPELSDRLYRGDHRGMSAGYPPVLHPGCVRVNGDGSE